MQVAGENIEFVAREAFDEVQSVVERVVGSIASRSEDKRPTVVFVFGASGSGKTRIGWQAYKTLGQPPMRPALAGYTYINLPALDSVMAEIERTKTWTAVPQTGDEIDAHKLTDTAAASRALERLLLENNQTSKLSRDKVPLHQLLAEWAAAIRAQAKQKDAAHLTVCLIVHIDEFQMRPWASACLVRAIRDANDKLESKLNVCVLPVLTGLSTGQTKRCLEGDMMSGVRPRDVHVQYFRPGSSDAMQVTLNAYNADLAAHVAAFGGPQPPALTVDHFAKIPQLRLLFEDAGGWTLGLVCVGTAVASSVLHRRVGPDELDMASVEKLVIRDLVTAYSGEKQRLGERLGLSATGWPKLLLLAMAPFEVRSPAPVTPVSVSVCVRAFGCVCMCVRSTGSAWLHWHSSHSCLRQFLVAAARCMWMSESTEAM